MVPGILPIGVHAIGMQAGTVGMILGTMVGMILGIMAGIDLGTMVIILTMWDMPTEDTQAHWAIMIAATIMDTTTIMAEMAVAPMVVLAV
jgi:hypothetical protein